MSLNIELTEFKEATIFESNITHNLAEMADAVGIYKHLWRPEEIGITHAKELIQPITDALTELKSNPELYRQYGDPKGWGTLDQFVPWLEEVLEACQKNPKAKVKTSR